MEGRGGKICSEVCSVLMSEGSSFAICDDCIVQGLSATDSV